MSKLIELKVGLSVYICIDEDKTILSELVGFKRKSFLILSLPGNCYTKFDKRQQIKLKFQSDDMIFYHSVIIERMSQPFKLLYVNFPFGLKTNEVKIPLPHIRTPILNKERGHLNRRYDRVESLIPIDRPGGDLIQECIVNMSKTGALLQLVHKFPIHDTLFISFELATGAKIKDLMCTVKRLELRGSRHLTAVQFEPSKNQLSAIEHYVKSCLSRLEKEN